LKDLPMLTASFEVLHDRFARLALGNVHLERLYTGCRWSEGPVYVPAGRYLLWSDIPNDRVMRWDESDGSVSVFQAPAFNANGHTLDRQGRVITCEHPFQGYLNICLLWPIEDDYE
jgi:gluconolactonase